MQFVLDACGLIAYLRGEAGGEKLRDLLKDSKNSFLLHGINLGEVYYDTLRNSKEIAEKLIDDIKKLPIEIIWTLDLEIIKLVGKYKISYKVSYADCYVLALAEKEKAIIITTDHHEFDVIERENQLKFLWLR